MAAAVVVILPGESWKPQEGMNPLLNIILMLLLTVGLPYFVLSATGPLLQAWFWRANPERSPYPLYALSNAGSLIALASYPILVEPMMGVHQQAAIWQGSLLFLLFLCCGCAWVSIRTASPILEPPILPLARCGADKELSPRGWWLAWSCCGVVLFMSVTNQLSLNVAAVPFLWVLPLSIYLFAFVLAFANRRWYSRRVFSALMVVALVLVYLVMRGEVHYGQGVDYKYSISQQIGIYCAALFVLCMVCHGELYRLKPDPNKLTSFYIWIALGGALGGILVGVVAPHTFLLYQELQLGLLACAVLFLLRLFRDPLSPLHQARPRWICVTLLIGVVALAALYSQQTADLLRNTVRVERNFYGVLRIQEAGAENPERHIVRLFDGATLHGIQFVHPDLRRVPTAYYTPLTGVGAVLSDDSQVGGRRVGIVGLGAGCLAVYGRSNDYFRYYEINPNVVELARSSFTFLEDSEAEWEIRLGDARLNLEGERNQQFDILVLDAFSSDAIPVHLLTREAFEVYERHLAPDGMILIHVSNLHFDLPAVLYPLADSQRFLALEIINPPRSERATSEAHWMVLARNSEVLRALVARMQPLVTSEGVQVFRRPPEQYDGSRVWTDRYSNLFQILK
jgi:hypothetical protein